MSAEIGRRTIAANRRPKLANYGTIDKYRRFVGEYMVDLDATRAAIAAGYAPSSAAAAGSKLLSKPAVQALIAEKQALLAERLDISAERVLQEYAAVAFSDIGDVADDDGAPKPLSQLKRHQRVAIAELSRHDNVRKVKLHDKRSALADLAKHLGLFERDNEQRRTQVLNAIIVPAKEIVDGTGADNNLASDRPAGRISLSV